MKRDFVKHYGPWAFVAGGSKGFGGAWCDALAKRGLNIVVVARDAGRLENKAQELRDNYGVEVLAFSADLTSDEVIDVIDERTKDLDIGFLVYNAGISGFGKYIDVDMDYHLSQLKLNCQGPMLLSHYFGQRLTKRHKGGMVLMCSNNGLVGAPYVAGYSATKSWAIRFAESLWYEHKEDDVDVIGCIAGLTRTYDWMTDDYKFFGQKPANPNSVVEECLSKLGKTPTMVPGSSNRRFSYAIQHLIPNKRAINMMGKAMKGFLETYSDQVEDAKETVSK